MNGSPLSLIDPSVPFACDAIFLEAAVGFVGEGAFDDAGLKEARHQFIEVASGFGFSEVLGKFCFGQGVLAEKTQDLQCHG